MVSPDPWSDDSGFLCEEREGCIYHVEFLGKEHTHLWVVEDKVPYLPWKFRSSKHIGLAHVLHSFFSFR